MTVLTNAFPLMGRLLSVLTIAMGALVALAQTPQPKDNLDPRDIAPQATVTVREHAATGADLIEITMLADNYPGDLLRSQVQHLCQLAGSAPRGLAVMAVPLDPESKVVLVKASFATDNIFDKPGQRINLSAIVKAFVGAPEPFTVKSILVRFENEVATLQTLKEFRNNAVLVHGEYTPAPPGLEYRIVALTQDPERISIPDHYSPPQPEASQPKPRESKTGLIIGLLIVAGLAAGALVYFFMQRGPRRA